MTPVSELALGQAKGKGSHLLAAAKTVTVAVLTPLLEKNVAKTLATDAPVIFSMSRLIVLAFAAALLRRIWTVGVGGWPDATLSIAIVLALPMMGALERANPAEVLEVTRALVSRFGIGSGIGSREPSKFDDHRAD